MGFNKNCATFLGHPVDDVTWSHSLSSALISIVPVRYWRWWVS